MNWGTVDPIEVVWVLASLPGVIVWIANLVTAVQALKAVKLAKISNGRLIVARYSVFKSWVMIGISSVFTLIGSIALVRPANPEVAPWDWLRVVLTIGLLAAPAAISVLGVRWRQVDQQIVKLALQKRRESLEENR